MSLNKDNAPLIIALGHKARSGKSECAEAIHKAFGFDYDIMRVSFADALRKEVEIAVEQMGNDLITSDKVKDLCLLCGVDYEPDAPITPQYPYSKQRALLQYWGTEYRRSLNPFYWVEALEATIEEGKAKIVVIDDLRFPNELFWVHHLGGVVIKVDRPGYKSDVRSHASETSLDGYEFDFTLVSEEDQVDKLREEACALFDIVAKRWSGAESAQFFQELSLIGQES